MILMPAMPASRSIRSLPAALVELFPRFGCWLTTVRHKRAAEALSPEDSDFTPLCLLRHRIALFHLIFAETLAGVEI
jgi:hypothetical protein